MVFLVSNFMECNYFQCKEKGNISVLSDFTFFVSVFEKPYDTANKRNANSLTTELCVTILSIDEHYFVTSRKIMCVLTAINR